MNNMWAGIILWVMLIAFTAWVYLFVKMMVRREWNESARVVTLKENLDEVKYNWDGTNYTIFDNFLALGFNFDNISALGESTEFGGVAPNSMGSCGIPPNSTERHGILWNS